MIDESQAYKDDQARRCRKLWAHVLMQAVEDATNPAVVTVSTKTRGLMGRARRLLCESAKDRRLLLEIRRCLSEARDRYHTETSTKRKARTWILNKNEDFDEVCQMASVQSGRLRREVSSIIEDVRAGALMRCTWIEYMRERYPMQVAEWT